MAVIHEAYFDESGTHNDNMLVVCGFVARAQEWEAFYPEWLRLMGSEETARSFKADECKDETIAERAADLVREHTACGFTVSIDPNEYTARASSRFRSQHGSAYTMCLKEATAQVGAWADLGNISTPINYWFDGGHRNQGQANAYFSDVFSRNYIQRQKLRLASWNFGDDKIVWPLKAADLLAHHYWRYKSSGELTPAMGAFNRDKTRVILEHHISGEDVDKWVDQLRRLYDRRRIKRRLGIQ